MTMKTVSFKSSPALDEKVKILKARTGISEATLLRLGVIAGLPTLEKRFLSTTLAPDDRKKATS